MTGLGWPNPGDNAHRKGQVFTAKVAAAQKHQEAIDARTQAEVQAELDLNTEFHNLNTEFHKSLLSVSAASIDRARQGAQTAQTAAASILAIYTTVLGVSFSVTDNPLPARGMLPAFFLGLAVVLSTVYLGYIGIGKGTPTPRPSPSLRQMEMNRSNTFILWARSAWVQRRYWLHAGIVALGVALAFLPAAFVGRLPGLDRITPAKVSPNPPLPAWPRPPTSGSIELQKIVYQAEVSEIASRREAKLPADPNVDRSWWWAALFGLIAVFLVPVLTSDGVRKRLSDHTKGKGTPSAA